MHFLYPFIHQWTFRLLPTLAVMNKTVVNTVNTGVQISLPGLISLPLDVYPEVGSLERGGRSVLS